MPRARRNNGGGSTRKKRHLTPAQKAAKAARAKRRRAAKGSANARAQTILRGKGGRVKVKVRKPRASSRTSVEGAAAHGVRGSGQGGIWKPDSVKQAKPKARKSKSLSKARADQRRSEQAASRRLKKRAGL